MKAVNHTATRSYDTTDRLRWWRHLYCYGCLLLVTLRLPVGESFHSRPVSRIYHESYHRTTAPVVTPLPFRKSPSSGSSSSAAAAASSTRLFVFERMSEECVAAILTAQRITNQYQKQFVSNEAMMAGCIEQPETKALERTLQQYRLSWRILDKTLRELYAQQDDDQDVDSSNEGGNTNKKNSNGPPLLFPGGNINGSQGATKPNNNNSNQGWLAGFRAAKQKEDRPFGKDLKLTFNRAAKLADQMGSTTIHTHHIFLALLEYQEGGGGSVAATIDPRTGRSECSAWNLLRAMNTFDKDQTTALDICQSLLRHLKDVNDNSSKTRKDSRGN